MAQHGLPEHVRTAFIFTSARWQIVADRRRAEEILRRLDSERAKYLACPYQGGVRILATAWPGTEAVDVAGPTALDIARSIITTPGWWASARLDPNSRRGT